jgi:hypothetical protein
MLYACYDLIRPDVILEMSWRNGLHDFTMPYMINLLSRQTAAIELLTKDNEERTARASCSRRAPLRPRHRPALTARLTASRPSQQGTGAFRSSRRDG